MLKGKEWGKVVDVCQEKEDIHWPCARRKTGELWRMSVKKMRTSTDHGISIKAGEKDTIDCGITTIVERQT
jgi:hypothetical protein